MGHCWMRNLAAFSHSLTTGKVLCATPSPSQTCSSVKKKLNVRVRRGGFQTFSISFFGQSLTVISSMSSLLSWEVSRRAELVLWKEGELEPLSSRWAALRFALSNEGVYKKISIVVWGFCERFSRGWALPIRTSTGGIPGQQQEQTVVAKSVREGVERWGDGSSRKKH